MVPHILSHLAMVPLHPQVGTSSSVWITCSFGSSIIYFYCIIASPVFAGYSWSLEHTVILKLCGTYMKCRATLNKMIDWLTGGLTGSLTHSLTLSLAHSLTSLTHSRHWLTDWLTVWLTDWLTYRQTIRQTADWQSDWLFDWLTDLLIDWLIDWLINCLTWF